MALICTVAYIYKYIREKEGVLTPSRPTVAPEMDSATAAGMLLHQIYNIEEVIVASVLYPSPNDLPGHVVCLCQFYISYSYIQIHWNFVQVLVSVSESVLSTAGEMVTKQPLIRSMRTVKRETLKLISGWVSRSNDPQMVRTVNISRNSELHVNWWTIILQRQAF